MISPKDKVDIEDFDSVGEYIAAAMEAGYTIEAEDFEGRPCSYCGTLIDFVDWPENVVAWDIREQDPDDPPTGYYHRNYFCSDECKSNAMRDEAWLSGEASHGEADVIHEDDLEGMA